MFAGRGSCGCSGQRDAEDGEGPRRRRGSGSRGPGRRSRRRGRAGRPSCRRRAWRAGRPGAGRSATRACSSRRPRPAALVVGVDVQLADLEGAGQPLLRRPPVEGGADLVVPPLAGRDQVAVAEADELLAAPRPWLGEGADGAEAGTVGVLDGVAVAAGDDGGVVAHGQAVDGQRLVHVVAQPRRRAARRSRVSGRVSVTGRPPPATARGAADRAVADLGGGAVGEPEQLVVGGREDRAGCPAAAQTCVVAGELDVDEGADRLGVADGGDAADGLAGVPRGRTPAVARAIAGDAEQGGDLRLVDPVRAAGQHEQRVAGDVEDQAVGDRAHRRRRAGRRPQRRCGRSAGSMAHLAGGAGLRSRRATSATRGCAGEVMR